MYGCTDGRRYGQSHDNQNFSDGWVPKFSKVWGSATKKCMKTTPAITDSRCYSIEHKSRGPKLILLLFLS